MRSSGSIVVAAACVVLSALAGGEACADDAAAAEAIFQEAKKLADSGDFSSACPKFEASLALEATLGTLLNVADCNEKIGRVATAWERFGEAEEWARRDKDDREGFAKKRRAALEPRVPTLVLAVSRPAAGILVYAANERVAQEDYGSPLPVDPGVVVVTVRRGEQELMRQEVRLVEGAEVELPLDLEAIAAASPPPPPPPPPPPSPDEVEPPPEPFWNGQRTAGFIVGMVGIAGVASFGVLEGIAISKKSEADEPGSCFEGFCTNQGAQTAGEAETFAEVGQWVGIGSAVVFGVGLTLFLTAGGSSPPPATQARRVSLIVPFVTPDAAGLVVQGAL